MDDVLLAKGQAAFRESGGTYGAPRIEQELRAVGLATSRKRVARLLHIAGLVARPTSRRRARTTDSAYADPIAPNRLGRQFAVDGLALNTIWVADITYVPTREDFLYWSTVLDLRSRRCAGWAMRPPSPLSAGVVRCAWQARPSTRRPA